MKMDVRAIQEMSKQCVAQESDVKPVSMIHTVQKVVTSSQDVPIVHGVPPVRHQCVRMCKIKKLSPFIREMESRVRQGVSSGRSSSEDLVGYGFSPPVLNVNVDRTTGRLSGQLALERFWT